mmetsp:Transcript_68128/g.172980  ORF Transcript_68128/g.172980 Transcript_68128/m.172980 type:complete len:242 (-) Transcript_68128:1792-2517(-)
MKWGKVCTKRKDTRCPKGPCPSATPYMETPSFCVTKKLSWFGVGSEADFCPFWQTMPMSVPALIFVAPLLQLNFSSPSPTCIGLASVRAWTILFMVNFWPRIKPPYTIIWVPGTSNSAAGVTKAGTLKSCATLSARVSGSASSFSILVFVLIFCKFSEGRSRLRTPTFFCFWVAPSCSSSLWSSSSASSVRVRPSSKAALAMASWYFSYVPMFRSRKLESEPSTRRKVGRAMYMQVHGPTA